MPGWNHTRSSSQRLGPGWQRLRDQVLKRDQYICQCARCKASGRVRIAGEVDHIIPRSRGGRTELSNLQAINVECHRIKTTEEKGGTVKPRIGLDGLPIE